MGTLYDEVLYPTGATRNSHPDSLATVATMFGMKPAPAARCRVLELGCGDGGNLIPMAFHMPESRFVGIDLAEKPIVAGNHLVRHLGLKNLRLEARDLMTVTPEFGEFDYIIAHGLYAWIPPPVQEKVLEVCRANLAPEGVAFVSYNTYPGAHLKMMVREMLHHFIRPVDASPRTTELTRQLLEFSIKSRPETGPWAPTMVQVSKLVGSRPINVILHDELTQFYSPLYFHEFAARAERHGLQFLGEAERSDLDVSWLSPEELNLLGQIEGDPVLAREQYLDFLKCRQFRETLLCRKERTIRREVASNSVLELLVSTTLSPESPAPDLDSAAAQTFRSPSGATLTLDIPPAKKLLTRLAALRPRPVRVADLVSDAAPPEILSNFLLGLHASGMVTLQTHWIPYVLSPGDRPEASGLILKLMAVQDTMTSHDYTSLHFGAKMKELVSKLDGTRTRAQLLAELATIDPAVTSQSLDSALLNLGELAILVR